jgi:hypothetical protein
MACDVMACDAISDGVCDEGQRSGHSGIDAHHIGGSGILVVRYAENWCIDCIDVLPQ